MKKLMKLLPVVLISFFIFFLTKGTLNAAEPDACLPTQPPPACNATCTPGGVACPRDCSECTSGPSGYTCKTPPACNTACSTPADCTGANDSCTACIGGVCKTPPACGVACSKDGDCTGAKDSCNTCVAGKCSLPPTPTPTPDPYNDDMCKCDGLETAATIEPDKPITITAYGKVLASDDKYAKISTVKFSVLKGNGNQVEKILETEPLPAEKTTGPSDIVRYKASWTFDLPQPVEKGVEYRIATNTKCAKNTAFSPLQRSVAAATTSKQEQGFLSSIFGFFSNLFGGGSNNITSDGATGPSPTGSNADQLKLGTFEPLKVRLLENNNCNLLRFQFEAL